MAPQVMRYLSQEAKYPRGAWGRRYPPRTRSRESWREQKEDDAAFSQWAKNLVAREPARSQEAKFHQLVKQWHEETDMHSSTLRAIGHSAYLEIIAMGERAIPLILHEMKQGPGHWLPAINAVTRDLRAERENPADGCTTASGARAAWVKWGESKGYL